MRLTNLLTNLWLIVIVVWCNGWSSLLQSFCSNIKIHNTVSRMFNILLLAQPDMMPKNNQELTQSKNWTWLSENEIAIKAKVTKNRAFKNSHNPANFDPSLNWTFELRYLSSAASGPLHWWKANLPTFDLTWDSTLSCLEK